MSISALTDDILKYIMDFLPIEDLCRITTVCKRWSECALTAPLSLKGLFPKYVFMEKPLNPSVINLKTIQNNLKRKRIYDKLQPILDGTPEGKLTQGGGKFYLKIPFTYFGDWPFFWGSGLMYFSDLIQIGGNPLKPTSQFRDGEGNTVIALAPKQKNEKIPDGGKPPKEAYEMPPGSGFYH